MNASYKLLLVLSATILHVCYVEAREIMIVNETPLKNSHLKNSNLPFDPRKKIRTAKGLVPYSEIEEHVYYKFGYKTVMYREPFAVVKRIQELLCYEVFDNYLAIAYHYDSNQVPPRSLQITYSDQLTLNGYGYMRSHYFDNRQKANEYWGWYSNKINAIIQQTEINSTPFSSDGASIYYATKYYNISGQIGIVISSKAPWVEAFCIKNGAQKLLVVNQQKVITDFNKIEVINPIQLAESWDEIAEEFDFAAAFSTIQHIGLGRYGDPIDPFGDVNEVHKLRCLLKPNGLLFLGVPAGMDGVFFNSHRVLGRLRLPMLFEGFELLSVFYGSDPLPLHMQTDYFNDPNGLEHLFVLKKLGD